MSAGPEASTSSSCSNFCVCVCVTKCVCADAIYRFASRLCGERVSLEIDAIGIHKEELERTNG